MFLSDDPTWAYILVFGWGALLLLAVVAGIIAASGDERRR